MGCNCKTTEIVLALAVLIFAFVDATWAQWIVALAAVLLIVHALTCKEFAACAAGASESMPAKQSAKPAKKK